MQLNFEQSIRQEILEVIKVMKQEVLEVIKVMKQEISEVIRQEIRDCVRREVVDIKFDITEIARQQLHLQRKQDQLVSKQDLLQTSIVGDYLPPFPPTKVITSPPPSLLSPSLSFISGTQPRFATGQALLQSPRCPPIVHDLEEHNISAEGVRDTDLDEIISFLTDSQLVQQHSDQSNVKPSDEQIPVGLDAAQQVDTPSITQPKELVLKTPAEVLGSNKDLWNERGVGKLANKLARFAYFGDSVLAESTRTGKERRALEEPKMKCLIADIRNTVFKSKTIEDFEDTIVPKINSSISALCKRLRNRK